MLIQSELTTLPQTGIKPALVQVNKQDDQGRIQEHWQDKCLIFGTRERPDLPQILENKLGGLWLEEGEGKDWQADSSLDLIDSESKKSAFTLEVGSDKVLSLRANVPEGEAKQALGKLPLGSPLKDLLSGYFFAGESIPVQSEPEFGYPESPEQLPGATYLDDDNQRHQHWLRRRVEFTPDQAPSQPVALEPGESQEFGQGLRLSMNGSGSAILLQEVEGKTEVSTVIKNGKVSMLVSLTSAEELSALLSRCPPEHPMTELLQNQLDPPPCTLEMVLKRQQQIAVYQDIQKHAASLTEGRKTRNSATAKLEEADGPRRKFSPHKSQSVPQGQFGTATEGHIHTTGLAPCVGLTFYDPKNKVGLLAHTDATKDVERSFDRMLAEFKRAGGEISNLEARVIGGADAGSSVARLLKGLEKHSLPVVELDVLTKTVRSIGMDTETGEVYDLDDAGHLGLPYSLSSLVSNLTYFNSVMTANGSVLGPLGAGLIEGSRPLETNK